MSTKRNEMLIALRSGSFVDEDGELVTIEAQKSRIAPELLERPGYAAFFEPYYSAPGSDSSRSVIRTTSPDGKTMVADERWD